MLSDPDKRKIYDAYGEEGLKGGAPPPGTPGGGFAGFAGAPGGGGGGGGGVYHGMDDEAARKIFESLFGGGLGGMFGGMGGMGGGGMGGGGGGGGPRVRIFQTGKRPRPAYEGEAAAKGAAAGRRPGPAAGCGWRGAGAAGAAPCAADTLPQQQLPAAAAPAFPSC